MNDQPIHPQPNPPQQPPNITPPQVAQEVAQGPQIVSPVAPAPQQISPEPALMPQPQPPQPAVNQIPQMPMPQVPQSPPQQFQNTVQPSQPQAPVAQVGPSVPFEILVLAVCTGIYYFAELIITIVNSSSSTSGPNGSTIISLGMTLVMGLVAGYLVYNIFRYRAWALMVLVGFSLRGLFLKLTYIFFGNTYWEYFLDAFLLIGIIAAAAVVAVSKRQLFSGALPGRD